MYWEFLVAEGIKKCTKDCALLHRKMCNRKANKHYFAFEAVETF